MNARGQRGLGVASAPNIVKKFNVCPSHSCLIRFKRPVLQTGMPWLSIRQLFRPPGQYRATRLGMCVLSARPTLNKARLAIMLHNSCNVLRILLSQCLKLTRMASPKSMFIFY